jgi:hypothetical protein
MFPLAPPFDTFTILRAWCNFCVYVSMLQSLCFYKHATTFMFMQACYNLCIFMILTPYCNTCVTSLLQAQQSFTQIACNGCTQFKFHTNCLQWMHTIQVWQEMQQRRSIINNDKGCSFEINSLDNRLSSGQIWTT